MQVIQVIQMMRVMCAGEGRCGYQHSLMLWVNDAGDAGDTGDVCRRRQVWLSPKPLNVGK